MNLISYCSGSTRRQTQINNLARRFSSTSAPTQSHHRIIQARALTQTARTYHQVQQRLKPPHQGTARGIRINMPGQEQREKKESKAQKEIKEKCFIVGASLLLPRPSGLKVGYALRGGDRAGLDYGCWVMCDVTGIVVFGASGDLAKKMVCPSLSPPPCLCVAVH